MIFNGVTRRNTIDVVEALAGQQAGRLVLVDVREKAFAGGMTAWERQGLDTATHGRTR